MLMTHVHKSLLVQTLPTDVLTVCWLDIIFFTVHDICTNNIYKYSTGVHMCHELFIIYIILIF